LWKRPEENHRTRRACFAGSEHHSGDCNDPDTILLISSETSSEAHARDSANSFVHRRIQGEPWRQVRSGLPASRGQRIAVLSASQLEPGVFYLSGEGEVYRSEDNAGNSDMPIVESWNEAVYTGA
jgi:hypothetical protein